MSSMRIGDLELHAVSDGTFVARPRYFGEHIAPGAHPELFRHEGRAWLPIGCFLIRTGDRVVLVDAGQGPEAQEMPHGMRLTGGRLPSELRRLDIGPAAVTDIVCTHLHGDHVGWLFGQDGDPVFPRATIWFGAADGRHFVSGPGAARSGGTGVPGVRRLSPALRPAGTGCSARPRLPASAGRPPGWWGPSRRRSGRTGTAAPRPGCPGSAARVAAAGSARSR